MRIIYLICMLSVLMFSCKKEQEDNTVKIEEEITTKTGNTDVDPELLGITFVGVVKKGDKYLVIDDCANDTLRFHNKVIQYYWPIEGAYYAIEDFVKIDKDNFKIMSRNIPYNDFNSALKNEASDPDYLPKDLVWHLKRKNEILWELTGGMAGPEPLLFTDYQNVVKGNIESKLGPCFVSDEQVKNCHSYLKDKKWYGRYEAKYDKGVEVYLMVSDDFVALDVYGDSERFNYLLSTNPDITTDTEVKLNFALSVDEDFGDNSGIEGIKQDFGEITTDGKDFYYRCPYMNDFYHKEKDYRMKLVKQ